MDRVAVLVDAGYLFAQGSVLLAGKKLPRSEVVLDHGAAVKAFSEFASTVAKVPLLRVYWYDGTSTGPTAQHLTLAHLWAHPAMLSEIRELLDLLEDQSRHLTFSMGEGVWKAVPLSVHASYSLDEILTACGEMTLEHPHRIREGATWNEETKSDLFFVTLEKAEERYSPTTMYNDYAVSPELFHWESQSITTQASGTGQRYINHRERGTNVLLFVRRTGKVGNRTAPYMFLGPADYVSHEKERPIAFVWRLRRPMPADFFKEVKVAAG